MLIPYNRMPIDRDFVYEARLDPLSHSDPEGFFMPVRKSHEPIHSDNQFCRIIRTIRHDVAHLPREILRRNSLKFRH